MAKEQSWFGAWKEVREYQLIAGLDATPDQRLAWLEDMILLPHRSGALPRKTE